MKLLCRLVFTHFSRTRICIPRGIRYAIYSHTNDKLSRMTRAIVLLKMTNVPCRMACVRYLNVKCHVTINYVLHTNRMKSQWNRVFAQSIDRCLCEIVLRSLQRRARHRWHFLSDTTARRKTDFTISQGDRRRGWVSRIIRFEIVCTSA